MVASTSFRISDTARGRLASRAAREGTTATALLDQLIIEGIDQLDYPGIIFRGPAHDRRAALAAGPDVWEVVARLQELEGSDEQRISLLVERESDLRPGSPALPWTMPRNTQVRSGNGSPAIGAWPSGAAGWPRNVNHCWRDILPDR